MFCRSLFVPLSFFFWSLYCLYFELLLLFATLLGFFFNFCLLEYQFELLYSAHCVRRLRKNRIKQATIFDLLVDHIVVGTKRKRHRHYNGTESIIKEEMSCVCVIPVNERFLVGFV